MEKSPALPSSHPPSKYLYPLMSSPLRLLFSVLSSPSSLNLSSHESCSSLFTIQSGPLPDCLQDACDMQFPSENTPPHTPSGLTSTPTFVYLSNISVGPQPSSHNHPHTLGPLKHCHGLVISACDMFLLLQLLALRPCRTPRSPSRCWHPGLQSLWPLVVCPLTAPTSLFHTSLSSYWHSHVGSYAEGWLRKDLIRRQGGL